MQEKPKSRGIIKEHLKTIRENTFSSNVVITPRTNGLQTGMLEDDVKGVLDKDTVNYING